MYTFALLSGLLLLRSSAVLAEPQCQIVLDGRIPSTATEDNFDKGETPFSRTYVKGRGLRWTDVIHFPALPPSYLDYPDGGKPVDVQITPQSSFGTYFGTGLSFKNEEGVSTGAKTYHFSVRQPWYHAPLDFNNPYMLAWHVTDDARKYHFRVQSAADRRSPVPQLEVVDTKSRPIFTVPVDFNEWQNFAITLDFATNKIRVFYSVGNQQLEPVTEVRDNDNSGRGRFQYGLFKYGKGNAKATINGVEESQIYGGVFVEDSVTGCISR